MHRFFWPAAAALGSFLSLPALAQDPGAGLQTYEVILFNATDGQPYSPAIAITHDPGLQLFQVGRSVMPELETLAESGDPQPLEQRIGQSAGVTDVVVFEQPILPRLSGLGAQQPPGMAADQFAQLEIDAQPGDVLTIVSMLVCTNDGFAAVNGVELTESGIAAYQLFPYDAGTERNTGESAHLPDACSELGPVSLAGDPNGNDNTSPAIQTSRPVLPLFRLPDQGELDAELHGWFTSHVGIALVKPAAECPPAP